MYSYLEMMNAVNMALANKDNDRLQRLKIIDHDMFLIAIETIEKDMGIDLSEQKGE